MPAAPKLSEELQNTLETIRQLARTHQVARLEVFGSAATDRFDENSDVDLLVLFKPMPVLEHGGSFLGLKGDLEAALGRRVDLLEIGSVTNPYFLKAIAAERFLLYAA